MASALRDTCGVLPCCFDIDYSYAAAAAADDADAATSLRYDACYHDAAAGRRCRFTLLPPFSICHGCRADADAVHAARCRHFRRLMLLRRRIFFLS